MKNKKKSSKIKTSKLETSFTGGNLSNYSGIYPIYKFMKKLKLDYLFNSKISIIEKPNQIFSLSQILHTILLGLLCGMNRLIKFEYFSLDPLLIELLHLRRKLDIDTIRYHLKKFTMKQTTDLHTINGILSQKVHKQLKIKRDILDLDSSVETVYGKQEGARKGYNSTHKGKRSYHPLFAFLNSTKECLLAWLRPGDAYTSNNAHEFLKQAFGLLPKEIKTLTIRADSGFFNDNILRIIELHKNFKYLIKVKMRNLTELLSHQEWEKVAGMPGWEMCQFYYKATNWEKARRFVAVRQLIGIKDPDSLFPSKVYSYFCYVTNIEDSPLYLHRLYGNRGESENWIEAVKNQLYAASILTQDFWVNDALFLLSVMAYNISVWMRKLTDEKAWRQEPLTFRLWFIQLAGKIVKINGKKFLKMYDSYYYKSFWLRIDQRIDALCFA